MEIRSRQRSRGTERKMATIRIPKKISEMAEDIELGESRFPKAFDRSNFKSQQEPDYFTPITNGTYFAFQQEENSNFGQENTTGNNQPRIYPQKSHSTPSEKRDKVKKLIKQSSEVGMLFLENSGEQVPKKVHSLIKRGSEQLDRILDGPHRPTRKDSARDGDYEGKKHKNFMEYKPEQLRLDTIPSPNLMNAEPESVNDSSLIYPTEEFGRNSYGTLPLIPVISRSTFSTPVEPSSMDTQDAISRSTSMGNVTSFQLPERLIEAIALNYPDDVCRQLTNHIMEYGQCETSINRAFWHACAHGADKSAQAIMENFNANPYFVYKNVPCIQLAARRGNIALLNLILEDNNELVMNTMPENACVTIEVPSEASEIAYRQSEAGDYIYHTQRRNSYQLGARRSKEKNRGIRFPRRSTVFRDEEDRVNSILVEYTHLSTPLHQTTLMNDVPMTKVILEKYKADIEAKDFQSKTALMYAAEEGFVQTLKYLLESEADIESRDAKGNTALLLACKNGNKQCILLLLQKGSNENAKDDKGRGLFEVAKDETVCLHVAKLLLDDSMTVKIPLHGLVKKGYSHCFQLIVNSTIHYRGDFWEFDLRTFQMDDNGVLPENEVDYKEKKQSLLQLISSGDYMDIVDCLPLRILVSHWLTRYGTWYIMLKMFFFILNMTALSFLFIYAADQPEPRELFNFNSVLNSIELICLVIVLLGWLMHFIFEVCEMVLRCKSKLGSIRTRHKERDGKISLQKDILYLFQAFGFGIFDYLKCLHNIIDLGIISGLPIFLVFCAYDSPIQWYFAAFLYFTRSLEIVKLLTVSPFGIYVHTIWATLSGDLPKFIFIVALSLFTFSGTLFIALRAPSNNFVNQTLPVSEMNLLRPNNSTTYWWLVLTSIRFLIEQGSVVKVDYIALFNWFAVLVLFLMLGWILLILRVIFIAHVSSTYSLSRNRAERYVTSYKLDFLLKMHENSFISLFVDLKKKFYNPTLEISRKEMRKYFESDLSYAQWDNTWVERVEDALSTRRKRNLQYKDKQLFNMKIGVADSADSFPDNQLSTNFTDSYMQDGSNRRPSCPTIEILEQQQMNIKEVLSRMFEENQRRMELSQFIKRREFNDKIDELKQTIILEMSKLNRHFESEVSLSSDND